MTTCVGSITMTKTESTSITKVLLIQLAIGIMLVILVSPLVIYRHSITIAYHKHRAFATSKAMGHIGSPTVPADQMARWERYNAQHYNHINALKRLGYLQQKEFRITFEAMNSPQMLAIREEYCATHPDSNLWSYGIHEGSLKVVDQPRRMKTWKTLVEKHDATANEPSQQRD
jgi:hypothetical protein